MTRKLYIVIGILFAAIGIASLVHPQFSYRKEQRSIQIGNTKELIETRRVIRVPRWAGGLFIVLGIGIAVTGWMEI